MKIHLILLWSLLPDNRTETKCLVFVWRNSSQSSLRPTVPISVFMTLGTEVHDQMFRSEGQSDAKPQCFVPKQAWYSFIDPLKRKKVESTLPSPGFEPRTCGVEE
ncbi:hypothetical protein TNCV_3828131 [Trichonephila clavipes]|nr:hypothetical protein TNCV_3828131 [Trichonephila clavipes]